MTLPFLSFVEISFETNLKVNKWKKERKVSACDPRVDSLISGIYNLPFYLVLMITILRMVKDGNGFSGKFLLLVNGYSNSY